MAEQDRDVVRSKAVAIHDEVVNGDAAGFRVEVPQEALWELLPGSVEGFLVARSDSYGRYLKEHGSDMTPLCAVYPDGKIATLGVTPDRTDVRLIVPVAGNESDRPQEKRNAYIFAEQVKNSGTCDLILAGLQG